MLLGFTLLSLSDELRVLLALTTSLGTLTWVCRIVREGRKEGEDEEKEEGE